ncbi:MAG: RNA-binding domain-containing protein [Halobacteriota archaeon]
MKFKDLAISLENSTVPVGVSNDGKVIGVDIGRNTVEGLANYIKRNTDPAIFPSVKILEIEGKRIIAIEVKESAEKPVFFKNHAYKRVGKTNQRISSSELRKLAKESGERVYWDEQICKGASLENIDWEFIKNFFIQGYEKFSKKRIIGTPEELLEALSCIKEGKPTNAGILLFGGNPHDFFRNSYIALARYKGKMEGVERLDYKEFFGNLFHQIDECDKYIKEHIAIMSRLLPHKVEREDIPEYC